MTTLLLARHGETEWNREGRWQGWADPPLNETGREQARALREQLRETPFDAVYSSDLRRAHETAEIVAAPHGVPVIADEGLREIDVGSWSGLTRAEQEARFPGASALAARRANSTSHAYSRRSSASPAPIRTSGCSWSRTAGRCGRSARMRVTSRSIRSRTAP